MKNKYLGHSKTVYCLDFSEDGTHLASGSADCLVIIWNLEEMS